MNQLAVLNKYLRLAGEANAKITGVESRKKANAALVEFCGVAMMGAVPVGVPAETVVMAIPEPVVGGISLGGGEACPSVPVDVEAAKTAAVEFYNGNPVLEPITDYEVKEVVGEVVTTEPAPEMRDGFPLKATITVASRCINPKLLAGRLGDGRQVSIEKGFRNWKVGDLVECELLRSGGQVLYRQIGTRT